MSFNHKGAALAILTLLGGAIGLLSVMWFLVWMKNHYPNVLGCSAVLIVLGLIYYAYGRIPPEDV